jgi:hypothetical protein
VVLEAVAGVESGDPLAGFPAVGGER